MKKHHSYLKDSEIYLVHEVLFTLFLEIYAAIQFDEFYHI